MANGNVVATVTLELVDQDKSKRWEACEGCPANHDPHTNGTLCNYLGNEANKVLGGLGIAWKASRGTTKVSGTNVACAAG